MSFLSDTSYKQFLDERIRTLDDATTREHVEKMFDLWYQQYRAHRLVERTIELLACEKDRPNMLYLRCDADVYLLRVLTQRHRFDMRTFRGFLATDELWDRLKPEWFSPFPLHRAGAWRDCESTVVITLSADTAFRENERDRGNDYMSRFIDLSRLADLEEIRGRHAGRSIVLYADYRKVQTIAAISQQIRTSTDLVTVLLADSAQGSCASRFDHVVEQPYYLWPLVFKTLQADIHHVDVGWGTQGLPFMPFVPDAQRAVVDFDDLTELVPEDRQEGALKDRVLARASERYLWTNCRHFVHRCFDPVTEQLKHRHEDRDIVSLVEYVKDPVYSHVSDAGADLKIVYAGIIIQDASDKGSVYYRRFMDMAGSFARDNLHLYIYPSPYLYGFGRPEAVEELIRTHGLANVHACEPLEEDEFVQAISTCDYGMSPPPDSRPCPYPDSLPYKVIAYLRAGLPIVVPEDLTYLAELVERYDIGVVYRHEDLDHMPEILSRQDVRAQKENVARFRSLWSIARGGEKMAAMYQRILRAPAETSQTLVAAPKRPAEAQTVVPQVSSSSETMLSLDGRAFLSHGQYAQYLEAGIQRAEPSMDKEYVRRKFAEWSQVYQVERMRQRAEEMLSELQGKPYVLYLDDARSLHVVSQILRGVSAGQFSGLREFVVEDDFLATLDVRQLGSSRMVPRSRDGEMETVIFSVSGKLPCTGAGNYVANDYLEKFIDLRRFDGVREIRRSFAGHDLILYPLYREIQTVPIMAKFIRQKDDRLRSVSLSPGGLLNADFDATLVEPFFYLWPLIFRVMDPSLVHLNVGWGIQALALSAFLPDRARTVVDFYEVLSFLPDAFFERTHSTAQQVRGAEEHFFRNCDHIMHLCSEETSTKLARKYDSRGSIVSVTEYLQEPTYDSPPRDDGEIRLVYGGAMLAVNSPDNFYYRPFLNVVRYYTRENLRLYIYNSPYLDGTGENNGLKEVIRNHGLANVFACRPLRLEEFVRKITEYDYGTFLLLAKDMNAGGHYNYYMAYKFLAYLRAGLPIVIDADNRYLAGLVEQHGLGVVLGEQDMENLPAILNSKDLPALKRNVLEVREQFRIEKGGEKVLKMYHEILRGMEDRPRCVVPVVKTSPPVSDARQSADFDEMIDVMARRENRLYYRDQSARTMSSLADLARQFDPSVIVELGTLGGLSLRTWIAATKKARIFAVDLSFKTLHETLEFLPADLSRVSLLEQDVLKTDFARLWTPQDQVVFFIDAHDLPNVPIMTHVLTTALPSLPDGSVVVIDDLWFSGERLTQDNARAFLEGRVLNEIDELQCFHGHFAPYHEGGSFMGFAEVIPLLRFVNEHGIPLIHDRKGKHAFFVWKRAYLDRRQTAIESSDGSHEVYGSVQYNPLESVPVNGPDSELMRRIALLYRQRVIREAAESLSQAVSRNPSDPGLSYGLAVCLARVGMLSQARDILTRNLSVSSHPRYRRLFDDLSRRLGTPQSHRADVPERSSDACRITLFAMPKAFTGLTATIQKNAIRSWARLDPAPEIILFGDEPGTREMAEEIGVKHIAEISRNEYGTPLVDKLFESAERHASNAVLAYVNADIILMQDFVQGVQAVQSSLADFLLIGRRWDLVVLDELDFSASRWRETLLQNVRDHAMLHAECGLDYFVFRKGLWPQIPPFAIGRTAWDNWLVMDPQKRGIPAVDGTECITAVHQEHDYAHVRGGRQEVWNGEEARRNRLLAGEIDDSAYTTGAMWALSREGQLNRVQPRPCEVATVGYRSRRIAWLAKQAERLIACGEIALGAHKWEETLVVLDKLTGSGGPGAAVSRFSHDSPVTRSYKTACISLAKCYEELENPQKAAASYARLLESSCIEIPQSQREDLVRERDRLLQRFNRQMGTPFQEFPADGATANGGAPRSEASLSRVDRPPTSLSSTAHPVPPSKGCGVTIFAMPKPFKGHLATIQRNAIRSWAKLEPKPEILLFGDEPGIREMAEEVGAQHIHEVGRNEFGTPLVNELFRAAQDRASREVLAYVNADIILLQDFAQAVQRVQTRFERFLLIGQRWDLPVLEAIDFRESSWRDSLLRELRENGMLHAESGLDYFVFRMGLWPQIPPFAIGRTAWDNWLVMNPHKGGVPVVDGTAFVTAVHQDHNYGHVAGGRQEIWDGVEAARNRSLAGPADHTGLTTGATWLLRHDGELAKTPLRQPRCATAQYREQRSAWLLRQAHRLSDIGANELAASQCEETIVCLNTWLELERRGCVSFQPEYSSQIAARCATAHTLLAQCYTQMGQHERVVATYTQLLKHPRIHLSAARRDEILRVRDQLACRLRATSSPERPPAGPIHEDVGSTGRARRGPEPPAAGLPSSPSDGPRVTVVTACHNSERYIEECVESILGQTMTQWELFLIDDGSTDGTRRLIEEYARRDGRIRPCCFPDNRGPYVRRNFAITRAASDFIVIQDADDIMGPAKLERLYREIHRDDRLAMVGSSIRTFLDEFRGLEHTELTSLWTDSDAILASCASWQAMISHGTAIIRKALFDTIGLYDENPFAADAFWSAKLALYAQAGAGVKMTNVPDPLTFIRIHPGSQTQTLPVFDPRSRRVRYRHYCECKLRRIREQWRRQPQLDMAAALRNCNCSDFLLRFKAKILQLESESLSVHFLNDLLAGALASFRSEAYVNCVVILDGLEVMQRDIARRVPGFDLLKAMALCGSGLQDRARTHGEREIENHNSSIARRFLHDSRRQGASMDVPRWYVENASPLEVRLVDAERERIGMMQV